MEIVIAMGCMASGKSTHVEGYLEKGYVRLNRDSIGGRLDDLIPMLEKEIKAGKDNFVLDNTYPTVQSRKPVIDIGKKYNMPVKCLLMGTSIEDAQVNAAARMIRRYGRLLMPEEIKKVSRKDPNIFPPFVLFSYRKRFEEPTTKEGFSSVEKVEFKRVFDANYKNKALLLDYDGTLRETKSGNVCPNSPDDIRILPGRAETLNKYKKEGYLLLGVSNQAGIALGKLSREDAVACFERTNELLGIDIEYSFCPHRNGPISCYCRKPMPGMGAEFIEKHKLDMKKTIMVGDMKSDENFARRLGVRYADQKDFFQA
ncbi:MAG: HAD-IIIA family hydrolase [Candidatus Woesearchaeota archaeon]